MTDRGQPMPDSEHLAYYSLRAAVHACTPMVRQCEPPRLGIQVMDQMLMLDVAHVWLVRADLVVLRGCNVLRVLTGPSEATWFDAVERWRQPVLAASLRGAVFLACVRVLPCMTVVSNRDIFAPWLAGMEEPTDA
jgi:hypothetical protein